jgi:hypothetical protein
LLPSLVTPVMIQAIVSSLVVSTISIQSFCIHTTFLAIKTASHDLLHRQCGVERAWDCSLPFQEANHNGDGSDVSVLPLAQCLCYRDHYYMFPQCYSGRTLERTLLMELKLAALLDGFCLVVASRVSPRRNESPLPWFKNLSIKLHCDMHRTRRKHNRTTDRKVSSKRGATKEECCPFTITIYLHVEDARTYSNR